MKKGSDATATALAAAMCLGVAAVSPWFAVPADVEVGAANTPLILTLAPAGEIWFRLGAAALALSIPVLWMIGRLGSAMTARIAAISLGVFVLFPACAVTLDSETGSRAAWLTQEHQSLVWLGGDIARSQGQSGQLRLTDVLVSDAPDSVRATSAPDWWPGEFGLERLEEVTAWLGYRDALSAFLCRGWPLALLGAALLLIAAARCSVRDRLGIAARGVRTFIGTTVASAGLVLLVPTLAGSELRAARDAVWRDDYREAVARLDAAARIFPLLTHDSHFLAQAGLVLCRDQQSERPEAQLWLTRRQVDRGLTHEPEQAATRLMLDPATPEGVRREAARLLSRRGFHALNSGENQSSLDLLELAALGLPVDPKISYGRQLAYLRTERYRELNLEVDRIRAIYGAMAIPSAAAVLSSAEDYLARAALAQGNAPDAARHLARRRDPR